MSNNPSHTDRFEELCAAYVLNALDAKEQREFEEMLEDAGEEQLQTYYAMRSAANQLAFTVEPAEPSEQVLQQLMARVSDAQQEEEEASDDETNVMKASGSGNGRQEEPSTPAFSRYAMALAASVALLLITLALIFYVFSQHSTINEQEQRITALQNELEQKEEMLSILEARTVDMIVMSGLDVNPNGYGKVIWDAEKQQALLQVSNLPAVPEGKDYQLWLIRDNKPIPSGVFAVHDPAKDSFFKIEELAEASQASANAFAITMEPEGGSPQPTGQMYLLGNVRPQSE